MGRTPKALTGNKDSGMTQISISLPKNLVDQIDEMAEADNRNRSNFIANRLANMAKEHMNDGGGKPKLK